MELIPLSFYDARQIWTQFLPQSSHSNAFVGGMFIQDGCSILWHHTWNCGPGSSKQKGHVSKCVPFRLKWNLCIQTSEKVVPSRVIMSLRVVPLWNLRLLELGMPLKEKIKIWLIAPSQPGRDRRMDFQASIHMRTCKRLRTTNRLAPKYCNMASWTCTYLGWKWWSPMSSHPAQDLLDDFYRGQSKVHFDLRLGCVWAFTSSSKGGSEQGSSSYIWFSWNARLLVASSQRGNPKMLTGPRD